MKPVLAQRSLQASKEVRKGTRLCWVLAQITSLFLYVTLNLLSAGCCFGTLWIFIAVYMAWNCSKKTSRCDF